MEKKKETHNRKTENKIKKQDKVLQFKLRILIWDSPVEYINNMYGSHPDTKGEEYFTKIYAA